MIEINLLYDVILLTWIACLMVEIAGTYIVKRWRSWRKPRGHRGPTGAVVYVDTLASAALGRLYEMRSTR